MTIVVGVIDQREGCVWMGADSCVSNGSELHCSKHPKIFEKNGFLIGFAGPEVLCQKVRHLFEPASPLDEKDIQEWMVIRIMPDLEQFFNDHGYEKPKVDEPGYFEMMIAYGNRLFEIGYDFSAVEHTDFFAAIGSGAKYALGAIFDAQFNGNRHSTPEGAVRSGLAAAAKFDAHCNSNVLVLRTKSTDPELERETE